MDVLVVLARHAGHVVSRDELLEAVWGDRVVSDDAVSRCIYQLRRHLARAGGRRTVIQTLPRRGYRLAAEIRPANGPGHAPGARHRTLLLLTLLMALAALWWRQPDFDSTATAPGSDPAPPVIAVLPFTDLGPEGERLHFGLGVADEIVARLSRDPELRVIARASAMALAGLGADMPATARRHGISHLLEGSVRSDGERLRVAARLIRARDADELWSITLERPLATMFEIQDEIARAVAESLSVKLAEPAGADHRPDGQAYADTLRARFLQQRRGPGDLEAAAALFTRAAERDPGLAAAWSGLASVRWLLVNQGFDAPPREEMRLVAAAAERALAIDPDQPEALARMGQYLLWREDFDAARAHFERAFEAGQNDPLIVGLTAGAAMRHN